KLPKTMKKSCIKCKTHTPHSVKNATKGKARPVAEGQRRFDLKMKGYGGMKKPKQHNKVKTTKKVQLCMTCSKCGQKQQVKYKRSKAVVFE
ncbi:MAG: hypothetical protein MHPSP_004160, partial [Paramarteilia canceri]